MGEPQQSTHCSEDTASIKPLTEKCCQAWNNASLEQLRRLLQQSPEQQNARALSCLKKAEILEMTVQKLERLKKPGTAAFSEDGQEFAAGYHHCPNAVSAFLSSAGSLVDHDLKSQIPHSLQHTIEARATTALESPPKVQQPQGAFLLSNKPLPPFFG
ncbi:unnamed protein product [Caretta caretta]